MEQDIMERALVLGDLRVASIMTPKVDVKSLNLDMDVAEINTLCLRIFIILIRFTAICARKPYAGWSL